MLAEYYRTDGELIYRQASIDERVKAWSVTPRPRGMLEHRRDTRPDVIIWVRNWFYIVTRQVSGEQTIKAMIKAEIGSRDSG